MELFIALPRLVAKTFSGSGMSAKHKACEKSRWTYFSWNVVKETEESLSSVRYSSETLRESCDTRSLFNQRDGDNFPSLLLEPFGENLTTVLPTAIIAIEPRK